MKWAYQTVKLRAGGLLGGSTDEVKLDALMNELGSQGWELAAAIDTNEVLGNTRDVLAIFKRPIEG